MEIPRQTETVTARTSALALAKLLTLDLNGRREAVAKDVRSRSPLYRCIPAHDLAEALGIQEADRPGAGWSFTRYAPLLTVEEFARHHSTASEVVYMLEGLVKPERFEKLQLLCARAGSVEQPSFSFLTRGERKYIEKAVAEQQLEANESNGMNCLGHCSVTSPGGIKLEFEGIIEDDGRCVTLRTPYDKRAKRFVDLSGCLTSYW